MNDHPKAIEARTQAEAARKQRQEADQRITEAVAAHGLRFVHTGPYTLCYSVLRRDVIRLSTAIKNPSDAESKRIARLTAVENYLKGNHVLLKRPKYPTYTSKRPYQRPSIRNWLNSTFYTPVLD